MAKAVLKKDLGKIKAGTVLHLAGGVFAHKGSTFLPEDVYFDDVHFEVIETPSSVFNDVLIDQTETSVHSTFPSINLASSFLRAHVTDSLV
jgi:hypothetical protein